MPRFPYVQALIAIPQVIATLVAISQPATLVERASKAGTISESGMSGILLSPWTYHPNAIYSCLTISTLAARGYSNGTHLLGIIDPCCGAIRRS